MTIVFIKFTEKPKKKKKCSMFPNDRRTIIYIFASETFWHYYAKSNDALRISYGCRMPHLLKNFIDKRKAKGNLELDNILMNLLAIRYVCQ